MKERDLHQHEISKLNKQNAERIEPFKEKVTNLTLNNQKQVRELLKKHSEELSSLQEVNTCLKEELKHVRDENSH